MTEENLNEIPFKEFPKIYRLNREIIITEKIDGTNGLIYNGENGEFLVGSRSRWIIPEKDNHGFAKWAYENKEELLKLGNGYHYGEWWGNGINRGYGLPKNEKRFSLFNVARWKDSSDMPNCALIVPILYQGLYDPRAINDCLNALKNHGSFAVPFMNPEGIVIHFSQANFSFKITLEGDEQPKGVKNGQ